MEGFFSLPIALKNEKQYGIKQDVEVRSRWHWIHREGRFLRLVRIPLVLGKHCLMVWVYWGFAQVYKVTGNMVSGHLTDHLTFK